MAELDRLLPEWDWHEVHRRTLAVTPEQAVAAFLASPEGAAFEIDSSREKFGATFNPGGYLRRVR